MTGSYRIRGLAILAAASALLAACSGWPSS